MKNESTHFQAIYTSSFDHLQHGGVEGLGTRLEHEAMADSCPHWGTTRGQIRLRSHHSKTEKELTAGSKDMAKSLNSFRTGPKSMSECLTLRSTLRMA